jgi:hypothetical protein
MSKRLADTRPPRGLLRLAARLPIWLYRARLGWLLGERLMKAIALVPGTTTLHLVEQPEPTVTAPDEVKLKMLRVGICDTDREQPSGGAPVWRARGSHPNGTVCPVGRYGGLRGRGNFLPPRLRYSVSRRRV